MRWWQLLLSVGLVGVLAPGAIAEPLALDVSLDYVSSYSMSTSAHPTGTNAQTLRMMPLMNGSHDAEFSAGITLTNHGTSSVCPDAIDYFVWNPQLAICLSTGSLPLGEGRYLVAPGTTSKFTVKDRRIYLNLNPSSWRGLRGTEAGLQLEPLEAGGEPSLREQVERDLREGNDLFISLGSPRLASPPSYRAIVELCEALWDLTPEDYQASAFDLQRKLRRFGAYPYLRAYIEGDRLSRYSSYQDAPFLYDTLLGLLSLVPATERDLVTHFRPVIEKMFEYEVVTFAAKRHDASPADADSLEKAYPSLGLINDSMAIAPLVRTCQRDFRDMATIRQTLDQINQALSYRQFGDARQLIEALERFNRSSRHYYYSQSVAMRARSALERLTGR